MTTPHHDTTPASLGAEGSALVDGRVAGVLYLVIVVFGIFTEVFVRARLIVPGDAVATAGNITNSGGLLRAGFAASLVLIICEVALTIILYRLLQPTSPTISLLAAAFRLVSLPIYGINLLNMFLPLVILGEAGYVNGLGAGRAETLALLFLHLHTYGYAIGLAFFALNCVVMGYLLVRSRYAPRAMGVLLGIAGLGYMTNCFLYFLLPGYGGSLTMPLLVPAVVSEVWLTGWLLWKGGGVREWSAAPQSMMTMTGVVFPRHSGGQ